MAGFGSILVNQTVNEAITDAYVDNMSLEQLKQFVYEDLISLSEHDDGDLLLANFWDLPEITRTNITLRFPGFDTGESDN